MNTPEHREKVLNKALEYLSLGLSVIPVGRDKRPLVPSWTEYQRRRPTEAEVREWWFLYEPPGLAIITGQISGIVVLDVEKGGNTEDLDIPTTPKVQTGGGGFHLYFKHPGVAVQNATRIRELTDVRGDGGYVVAPPSLHTSGGAYEWITDLETPLAPMPDWMNTKNALVTKTASVTITPKVMSKWARILQGVSEGGRHDALVKVIGKLQAHLPKKDWDDVLLPLADSWNARNNPPLSDDEVWRTYDDMRARYDNGEPEPRKKRPLYTVSELLEHEPAEYPFLVEPLVPYQGITALSGHPGAGKSWVTLHLAQAVASGEPVFGKFKTAQGNVLVVDEESGLDEMHKRARKLGFTDDLPVFFHVLGGFKLDNSDDLGEMLDTVEKKDIKLVILDPFVAFHSKAENSAEEIQQVAETMQRILTAGAAVLYVHHHRKDSVAKFGYGQSLRGSSALLGRLDSHVVVKKISSDEVSDELEIIHEKSRRSKNATPFKVSLVEEDSKISFTNTADIEPAKLKIEQAQEAILTMLEAGGEMSRKDILTAIKKETGIGSKNASDALRALVELKAIVERREGKEKHYKVLTNEQE